MSVRINGVDRKSTILGTGKDLGATDSTLKSSTNYGTGKEIGAIHLANNPNLYEIQRSNNFEFIVTGIDDIMRACVRTDTNGNPKVKDKNRAYFPKAQEIIRISVDQAFVPHFSQAAIEVKRGNNSIRYAGTPSFNSGGNISLVDYIGVETVEILMAWQNLSYNVQTEKVGLASDYKKDCYLIQYSPDYQPVRRWILHGCWVSDISEDAFNSNGGTDKRNVSCRIEYDYAEVDTSEI